MLDTIQKEQEEAAIKIKLVTALKRTLNSLVIGAGNKIENVVKTNGWSQFFKYRYDQSGTYKKIKENNLSELEKSANRAYCNNTLYTPQKEWYFSLNRPIRMNKLMARDKKLDPLKELQINSKMHEFFRFALTYLEKHQGNCHAGCILFAKNLWEQIITSHDSTQLIKKIEIVKTLDFDHYFIIVNRDGDIATPESWGDAWIIDTWFQENGLIYRPKEFTEKMKEIKQFAITQTIAIAELGVGVGCYDEDARTECRVIHEINPNLDPYPTFSLNPFYPAEFYYSINTTYPSNSAPNFKDLLKHHDMFKACLIQLDDESIVDKTRSRGSAHITF